MILWISVGSGGGLARDLNKSHPTTLYYDWGFAREKRLYDGLAPQVQSLEDGLAKRPDAVLFESTGLGDLAERLRTWVPVWGGGGAIQDVLEKNRGFCVKLVDQCGIRVPRTVIFDPEANSWLPDSKQVQTIRGWVKEAIAFAQKEKGTRWVIKPYESDSSATTYVAEGVDDLVDRLQDLDEENQIPKNSPFVLQEFIEGLELSTEVWVSQGRIVPGSWNNTIELKKFYPGDMGPTVGSTTSTVWFLESGDVPQIQQTFGSKKLQQWFLQPTDDTGKTHRPYSGPIDFNSIISKADGKMYFLEATPRPGWMTYYATIQLLPPKELGSLFVAIAKGRLDHLPSLVGQYAYEITMSRPPYPTTEEIPTNKDMGRTWREILDPGTGIKISGPISNPNIHWVDVRINQHTGQLETAGTFGQIASITGTDRSLEKARDQAHHLFEQINLPEKMGRVIDGADRALEQVPKLRKLGYSTP